MAKNTFDKGLVRSIKDSLGRFLGIAVIAALGAGFFAGLRMTGPDMRLGEDQYFDQTNLFDLQVISTLGLEDEDIDVLAGMSGVSAVMPSRELDAMSLINDEQYTVCIHQLDTDAAQASVMTEDGVESEDSGYINRPVLIEGEWPDEVGECVIAGDIVMDTPVEIGDTVELLETSVDAESMLETRSFTIVGKVLSPYYVENSTLGTSSLGNGMLNQYLYVPEETFVADTPYTKAFITVEGARELNSTSDEYAKLIDDLAVRIEDLEPFMSTERLDTIKSKYQDKLDGQRELFDSEKADALKELNEAKAQLDSTSKVLSDSLVQLESGEKDYSAGKQQLDAQRNALPTQLQQARDEVEAGRQRYHDALAQKEQMKADLAHLNEEIKPVEEGMGIYWALDIVESEMDGLDPASPEYVSLAAQKAHLEQSLANQGIPSRSELEPRFKELEGKRISLVIGIGTIESQTTKLSDEYFDSLLGQIDDQEQQANVEFEQADAQLAQARADLDAGWVEYNDGLAQYEDGMSQYEKGYAEAEEQFAEVESQLDEAQEEIDSIEKPDWFVLNRTQNLGAASHAADSDRMDKIASFFPLIFFLVAALVSLTCMTRMVDEERILIGTYKALGYSNLQIASKYLIYAALASSIGSITGLLILSQFLPRFIMECYGIIYTIPPHPTPINFGTALFSVGLSVGITVLATAGATVVTLREQPAALMLPRAPKAGKRIFLERIYPLWEHMSFSWKVTCRNLLRYKRRFFMATIGIAGCTALLLTGLGLRDSINDIIDLQFGQIFNYSMRVKTDDNISLNNTKAFHDVMNSDGFVEDSCQAMTNNYVAVAGNPGKMIGSGTDGELRFELIVPKDANEFQNFLTLRNRQSQQPLSLSQDGVILSEKTAKMLNVEVGDTFSIYNQNVVGNALGDPYTFTVGGITENYVQHFIYMDAQTYENTFGTAPHFSTTFAKVSDDVNLRVEKDAELRAIEGVKMINYNDESIDSYVTMIKTVDSVVIVLVVAAALLAFVVLYNLTNINISEREREIATLKVLGFTPREVNAYIFRETILLSIIGGLAGLVMGIFFENIVVLSVEVDMVMFGRTIHAVSFVISFVLTMVFSALVSLIMSGKLKAIDMVSSLKSVE